MSEEPQKPAPKLTEHPRAPEIYADGVSGFFLHNQNLHITFEVSRADHSTSPGPVSRCIVARIVMPSNGARSLAVSLFDFLKQMGTDPGQVVPSVSVQPSPGPGAPTPPPEAPRPVIVEQKAPPAPVFTELAGAIELFADSATGYFLHNGILRIAFDASRFDHANATDPASRLVIGRIAMPVAGASSLAVNLFDFLKKMGIDPASVSTVPTMQ